MKERNLLYPSFKNPFLIRPERPLPEEMAVIGAGHIGPDIAYFLRTGLPEKKLYLVDVAPEPLQKAKKRFEGYAQKGIERKTLTSNQAEAVLRNIVYTTDYEDIRNCDLVIEAATEDVELKRKIFSNLESIVGPETILTSNTSGIPADRIFNHLKHPERATITHFFTPAWRSMAVEVINWGKADTAIVDFLLWFLARAGKAPVVTRNVSAFLLNRIFDTWVNEAVCLLDRAESVQVDSVCEEFVGAGPFFVVNLAGGNPLTYASQVRRMAERNAYKPPAIYLSVDKWMTNPPGTKVDVPVELAEWIRMRMLGGIFSQCFDIADRDIGTPADLNFGSLIGLGFKKGVFDMMADLGVDNVSGICRNFDEERPGFPQAAGPIEEYLNFNRDILVDQKDGVKILTIRRPQAANALEWGTCDEIFSELAEGERDPEVRGFVITGYGTEVFCAGAAFDKGETGTALSRGNSKVLDQIDAMTKPVVAAVNGLARAGGVALATRCHSRVATENASFQLSNIPPGNMIENAGQLAAHKAAKMGIVKKVTSDFPSLIDAAIAEVNRLRDSVSKDVRGVPEKPERIFAG